MDEANAKGLKWYRAQDGRTSTAELGPIGLLAWSDNVTTYAEVDINGDGPTLDHSEAAAEAKLREAYDALREHFDPVPVLRWTIDAQGNGKAKLGEWVLFFDASWWRVETKSRVVVAAGESYVLAHPRASVEAALRSLGVSFRVEGE